MFFVEIILKDNSVFIRVFFIEKMDFYVVLFSNMYFVGFLYLML